MIRQGLRLTLCKHLAQHRDWESRIKDGSPIKLPYRHKVPFLIKVPFGALVTRKVWKLTRPPRNNLQKVRPSYSPNSKFLFLKESHRTGVKNAGTGLLNSPKTKMINGIMLVVFPYPFVQVSLWRLSLDTTDWIVVPGAWVPNPPNADGCTPVAFSGLGFGKVKALFRKPRHQHLLVGDPLNSVG